MSTTNKFYDARIHAVHQFLDEFSSEFGHNFSAGICGSMTIGEPRCDSDIDMIIVIDPEDIKKALSTKIFKMVFNPNIADIILEKFVQGDYDIYRPRDGLYKDIIFSVNFFAFPFCVRLSNLADFLVQKFRYADKDSLLLFRGFNNINGQKKIPFQLIQNKEICGVRTQSMSLIRHLSEPYFHINIDKLYTAEFVIDNLNVKECQKVLQLKMYEEFLDTPHKDPFGFLEKRDKISPDQLNKLQLVEKDIEIPEYLDQLSLVENIKQYGEKLIIITGPSGVGKDALVDICTSSNERVKYYIPITTRKARTGEKGVRYHFETEKEFKTRRARGDFLFWQYNGVDDGGTPRFYGVCKKDILEYLKSSEKVFVTVGGVLGASTFKRLFPQCTTIFIRPKSVSQLLRQLMARGTDSQKEIEYRLNAPRNRDASSNVFDYEIINYEGCLKETAAKIMQIVKKEISI